MCYSIFNLYLLDYTIKKAETSVLNKIVKNMRDKIDRMDGDSQDRQHNKNIDTHVAHTSYYV